VRICPQCGFKDPAQIRAAARFEAKRLAAKRAKTRARILAKMKERAE